MSHNQEPVTLDSAVVYATDLSKQSAQAMADSIIRAVEDGTLHPLKTLAQLKWAEMAIKAAIEGVMPTAVYEADKYGKDERITAYGCELKTKEAGTRWDFSSCGDPVYQRITEQSEAVKQQQTEREGFLKSLKSSMTVADEETGEMVTISPAAKQSKTIVEVRIK